MKRIAAILLACSASFANAQFMSAQDLLTNLDKGGPQAVLAAGYIAGVVDVHYGIETCIPDGTTATALAGSVRKALTLIPDLKDIPANYFVLNVVVYLWPCKGNERKPLNREPAQPQFEKPVFRRST